MKRTLCFLFGLLFLFTIACTPKPKEEKIEISYEIPEGYELEILYAPKDNKQGSWVSLAEGPNGTFFASDQWGDLYHFKVPAYGEVLDSNQVKKVGLDIGNAQGLLWAFNSLYVSVNERWENGKGEAITEHGSGIYRLRDTNDDGELDEIESFIRLEGEGEHGPHSLILSPDQKHIYFIAGNHTDIPEEIVQNSFIPPTWGEDNLFTPYLDARGHANDIKAPGGWVARFTPDGKEWELVSVGYRNPFDFGFNPDGELFAFDSDMEWDIGLPWYRPIRVCHVSSGSEFGWRTGSGKWPAYYPDNLPAVVNLGQGSPTAVVMGTNLDFPAKYKNGMFVFDWSFGTVYYVDLKAQGSSYTGVKEEFFSGTPLPLTDAIAGSDGALYFATGGRNLESHLYRLSYQGGENAAGQFTADDNSEELRALRRELESYHNESAVQGLDLIWNNLSHEDRFIRYAARVGLEHVPAAKWVGRLAKAKSPLQKIQAVLALARSNSEGLKEVAYLQLSLISWKKLDNAQKLDYLRAISMSMIRFGEPGTTIKALLITKLSPHFPSDNTALDRELSQVLLALGDESSTAKTIALLEKHTKEKTITHPEMLSAEVTGRSEGYGPIIDEVVANMPPTEALYFATLLSHIDFGWNDELREKYFTWFYDGLSAKGGLSFKPFMENIRVKAMSNVPEEQKEKYETLSGVYQPGEALANVPQPEGPGKEYSAGEIQRILSKGLGDYKGTIEDGKRIYEAALCASCHRMKGEGGNAGPDLSQLHTRFGRYAMVFTVYSPNDEISDQYANTLFEMKDGTKVSGKVLSEDEEKFVVAPNPYSITYNVELEKANIASQSVSPISPMPPGLLNRLNEQEITHLFAYLLSGGDKDHYYYTGKKETD